MAVSDFAFLRQELSKIARDTYGAQWSDTALDSIINQAQREYSIFSGKLTGSIVVNSSGRDDDIHIMPDDFIEPLKFIGQDGRDVPVVSWQYLHRLYPDFRKITGSKVQGVCFDYYSHGQFLIFPRLEQQRVGQLFYRRFARDDFWEGCNTEAIKNHCLYQMFFLTSKNAAGQYLNEFYKLVNKEARSNTVLRNRQKSRHGSFY